ncbi:MAG: cyclopropane-fatty-acyl-phospholipid synthase family protein [Pseudomonadota bacterium]
MSAENIQSVVSGSERLPLTAQWLAPLLQGVRYGRLILEFDDGNAFYVTGEHGGTEGIWRLHHPARLFRRVIRAGIVGIAEGYHEGDWSSPQLADLLCFATQNAQAFEAQMQPGWGRRLLHRITHWLRPNSMRGSRRNIAAHYDLGNDFYRLWLDEGMTYSSAIGLTNGVTLEQAQRAKYDRLLDSLDARPGEHVLEIGCGWGGLAEQAGRRGLQVSGITLSSEQLAYARQRIHALGLEDRVSLALTDYRDQQGQFDHIVSIEMFEAVGEKYWPEFFRVVYERLHPGGKAAIQVIIIDESCYDDYRRNPDYIQLYIFPGGMLPTRGLFIEGAERAGLTVADEAMFGRDYARTLHCWRESFESKAREVSAQGYDLRFQRMWSYYLAYCEAGFRSGRINLMQIVLQRPHEACAAHQSMES